jgi:hypothetical protein
MKKIILSAAIFFTTLSLFAGSVIKDPVKGRAVKKESQKRLSKKSTNKVMLCQVLEVKDENNNITTMAVFAEAPVKTGTKANTSTNSNTYLNHMFFADVKIVEQATAVTNYEEHLTILKQRYADIKIWGTSNNAVAVK